jgi:hypothetical protein
VVSCARSDNLCWPPLHLRPATASPMSTIYYLARSGRADIRIAPLYDCFYTPQEGDLIVLEPSRRFLEAQDFFSLLDRSGVSHWRIHAGPVTARTPYLFQPSALLEPSQEIAQAQPRKPPPRSETHSLNSEWATANRVALSRRPVPQQP